MREERGRKDGWKWVEPFPNKEEKLFLVFFGTGNETGNEFDFNAFFSLLTSEFLFSLYIMCLFCGIGVGGGRCF